MLTSAWSFVKLPISIAILSFMNCFFYKSVLVINQKRKALIMQFIENKNIFFMGLFLFCAQLMQGMDQPNISSLLLPKENKQIADKGRLIKMLQDQKIDIYPSTHSAQTQEIKAVVDVYPIVMHTVEDICGRITFAQKYAVNNSKNIQGAIFLERYHIESGMLKCHSQRWDNVDLIEGCYNPIFNEKDDFSFYVLGIANKERHVFECTISSTGNAAILPCMVRYKKGTVNIASSLGILCTEPDLLQDILKSPSDLESSSRIFKIEDIVFSEEYEELAQDHNFWLGDWILTRPRVWYEEVIELKEQVFDAETYFAQRPDYVLEIDKYYDLRRALKMAMWYQYIYKKVSELSLISSEVDKTMSLYFNK